MAKFNPASTKSCRNNLFNLKSFNSLKKDQTNIKIFKNSAFDSNFNSVQSLNTNLSNIQLILPNNLTQEPIVLNRASLRNKLSLSNTSPYNSNGWHLEARENKQELPPACFASARINNKNIKNLKFIAILRAIRSIRLNRDEWRLIRIINLMEKKIRRSPFFGCFSPTSFQKQRQLSAQLQIINNNINSNSNFCVATRTITSLLPMQANMLLRNTNRYKNLKSILSSILKIKIRSISEVLENKPIKNYVLYSYLKNCISLISPHLNGGKTKLSLNKYKGRKYGSFIKYNKIIGYKFNSTFYQSAILNTNTIVNYPALPIAIQPTQINQVLDLPASGASSDLLGVTKIGIKEYLSSYPLVGRALAPQIGDATAATHQQSKLLAIQFKGIEKNRVASAVATHNLQESNFTNIYIKDIYKLLFYLFKSMYCLISKPVLKYTNDKVTIQLFYYLNIPKKKIFRLFSIFYINSIKKKWLALIEKKKTNLNNSAAYANLTNTQPQIYISWKLRKAISRFKNKNIPVVAAATTQQHKLLPTALLADSSICGEAGKNILFKLRKFNLTAKEVYQNKFKLICAILSNKFNKPVELQLIRLHHPYHDSNILVNLLSLNIKNKRKKAKVAVLAKKIYNKKPVKFLNDPNLNKETANLIPAFLSGLNIKIAGRLMGEPIIPRITTKVFGKGANATGKVNYLDVARITKKNRKGAYTIKITSGQNFF